QPADVRARLADLVEAADDHVVDQPRVDASALDERPDRLGREVHGVPVLEPAAAAPEGGPHGVDDDRVLAAHHRAGSRYAPQTARKVSPISPKVAPLRAASIRCGITFSSPSPALRRARRAVGQASPSRAERWARTASA